MKRRGLYKSYVKSPHTDVPRATLHGLRTKKKMKCLEEDGTYSYESGESDENSDMNSNEDICNDPSSSQENDQIQSNLNFLFQGSKITVKESAILIYAFVVRHGLPNSAINDLLELIRLHMPEGNYLPVTRHNLMKELDFDYSSTSKHYYCNFCQAYIGPETTNLCHQCKTSLENSSLEKSKSYFFSFDAKSALLQKLNIPEVNVNLQNAFRIRSSIQPDSPPVYANIMDGKLYKSISLGQYDLTCLANSDGVPVFKSNKFSIWPILITINELGYKLGRKHAITLGLWFGNAKPNFTAFLEPFVQATKRLASEGILWNVGSEVVTSRIFFPVIVADSVARPLLQNLIQFNGMFGCPWCLLPGKSVSQEGKDRSHKWIYPPVSKNDLELRTQEKFLEHLRQFRAIIIDRPKHFSHYGVKGASQLLRVPKFDIVNGFVFDYMHTCLLGVTRMFAGLWLESDHHASDYYIGNRLKEIDILLRSFRVPFKFDRVIRSLFERRFWKASEWKTWMLIVPTLLSGILPDAYLEHFTNFVNGVVILCSEKITEDEVTSAEKFLFKFVKKTKVLYGEYYCNYNVHILTHAANCVRNWGPLYFYSAFAFENYNGILLKLWNGTVGIPIQIAKRVVEINVLSVKANCYVKNEMNYFEKLFETSSTFKKVTAEEIYLPSRHRKYAIPKSQQATFASLGHSSQISPILYDSCIVRSNLFKCHAKSTAQRCNSVCYAQGKNFQIESIILVGDSVYIVGKELVYRKRQVSVGIKRIRAISDQVTIFPASLIESKLYIVNIDSGLGQVINIVMLPNSDEIE